jgi:dynactin complex subunit
MSEYEALREDIGHVASALASYSETAVSHLLEQSRQIDKLWTDNAALRDDLHALANRVETLTRARLTEPAEVAERMQDAANVGRMAKEYGRDA